MIFHLPPINHVKYICKCNRTGCMFCDGGLFSCINCKCIEGSLPTHCPGFDCYDSYGDEIYAGLIDFKDWKWVKEPSRSSPAYYRKSKIKDA